MSESTTQDTLASATTQAIRRSSSPSSTWPLNFLLLSILVPSTLALLVLYTLDPFDPSPLPLHELSCHVTSAPKRNENMLKGSEFIGVGALPAPEDVAYDEKTGMIYTGCADGWVKRVKLSESGGESAVENWVNTGGRPLGLAHGRNGEVLVADTEKGLLKINEAGEVELLTDEAEGVKFKLTDAVDVANDGMIYFTDASYKYKFKDFIFDILEGKPHGRLLSYDPKTKVTTTLVSDLYFANGVAVSPDQSFVIFCETIMRRCKKYYLQGEKKGNVENFIENLPGPPDNIRYDGEGHYWIALSTEMSVAWDLALKYPFIRKWLAIMEKYTAGKPQMEKNSGVFAVNLDGEAMAHYSDPGLAFISSATKIGKYLYCGSIKYPYIIRFDLEKHPAHVTTAASSNQKD